VDLRKLADSLREIVEENSPTKLSQLAEEARALLEEPFRIGTVRRWGGIEYQKQSDRTWAKVPGQFKNRPAQGGIAPVPVVNFPKKPVPPGVKAVLKAVSKKKAPSPTAPASAPPASTSPAKKATADNLPDDPYRYFHKTPDSKLIPVSALKTIRARPTGIENAAKHMANAFNGEGEKRKPISVSDNGDGTYTVNDGNSTTAIAQKHAWKNIVAVVEPAGKGGDHGHAPADKPAAPVAATSAEVPHLDANLVAGLNSLVLADRLKPGVSVEQHVKIAQEFLGKHEASLHKSLQTLQANMPKGTKVKGRVKKLPSALGKLVRKPKYGTVDKLQDGTGMRVIAPDRATLDDSIRALKANYKIVEEDDYVSRPQGGEQGLGYRSYHAIIEDKDGLQKEIQIRTPNQDMHADWCHDIYKPVNAVQEEGMKKHAEVISKYARDMGDYFAKVDAADKPGNAPPCPPEVKQYFSCL
jgi:ppGpp synthetase/RelA/SpoT-type nucleotidyltranferase